MELIDIVNRNKGLADFLQSFILNCPDYLASGRERKMTDVDIMKSNFCRYTKRTMYYAENFLKSLNKVKSYLDNQPSLHSDDYMTNIPDDIYFDFDAFVFSCKSILEGKLIERSKGLHPLVIKDFNKYAKTTFERFIKSYLTPLRDEVVHLNNFGSAMGSMVWIKNKKLHIRAFDYSDNMELQKVFTIIMVEMTAIINNVAKFLMLHDCNTWGFPERDIIFSTGRNEYKISEYINIPSR